MLCGTSHTNNNTSMLNSTVRKQQLSANNAYLRSLGMVHHCIQPIRLNYSCAIIKQKYIVAFRMLNCVIINGRKIKGLWISKNPHGRQRHALNALQPSLSVRRFSIVIDIKNLVMSAGSLVKNGFNISLN